MTREATLCQNSLNTLEIFARISKFRFFHETKQIQNEVGRFFYNLAEFVFEYFCDSQRILTFAKFCLNSLLCNTIIPLYKSQTCRPAHAHAPLRLPYRFFHEKSTLIYAFSLRSKIVCSLWYNLLYL